MKKILVLLIVCILSACTPKGCNPNDSEICFDVVSKHFLLENNAHIKVAVPNEGYGSILEALWDETYPDRLGLLEAVIDAPTSFQGILDSDIDLHYVESHMAVLLKEYLISVDEQLAAKLKLHLAPNFIISESDLFFMPMSAYGVSFATNIDYLSANSLSIVDTNLDGLVDAYDTFEKIAAAQLSVPFDFSDSLFTQGFSTLDYSLFKEAKEDVFSQQAFLDALNSLAHLGQLYRTTGWTYEQFLDNPNQAFSMVGTWMYYEEASSLNFYSKLPSFEGKEFKTTAYPSGYVIKKSTAYPNAAYEVLDLILSEKGMQAFSDTTELLLVYHSNLESTETQLIKPYGIQYKNEAQAMMAKALLETQMENYEGLVINPSYRYYDSLKAIEYQMVIAQVFKQEISPEEAQILLDQRFSEWLDSFKEEE